MQSTVYSINVAMILRLPLRMKRKTNSFIHARVIFCHVRARIFAQISIILLVLAFAISTGKQFNVEVPTQSSRQTISFDVCNGFANQRIAIVTAALLAKRAQRALILPSLGVDGEQLGSLKNKLPSKESAVLFSEIYDQVAFRKALAAHDVDQVLGPSSKTRHVQPSALARSPSTFRHVRHIHVACPILNVPANVFLQYENMLWSLLIDGLQPSAAIRDRVIERHRSYGPNVNVLHLRIEQDWVEFCKHWTGIHDGVTRDNCLDLDARNVVSRLASRGMTTDAPIYIASHLPSVPDQARNAMMLELKQAGYRPVLSECILPRELCAAVDYYYALSADKFIGNSVSTFSAMLIMERRYLGRHASYYNGGTLPLAQWLPFYKLAWVVISEEAPDMSSTDAWIARLKQSVDSGIQKGNVQPFVLLILDNENHVMSEQNSAKEVVVEQLELWLSSRGVPILSIRRCALKNDETTSDRVQLHDHNAPNNLQAWKTLAMLARKPEWKLLMQHPYALVTSDRLEFTARLDLYEFGSKLPVDVASAACDNDSKHHRCVALANLARLRESVFRYSRAENMNQGCASAIRGHIFARETLRLDTEKEVSHFVKFT
jgi:hypothetical protein